MKDLLVKALSKLKFNPEKWLSVYAMNSLTSETDQNSINFLSTFMNKKIAINFGLFLIYSIFISICLYATHANSEDQDDSICPVTDEQIMCMMGP